MSETRIFIICLLLLGNTTTVFSQSADYSLKVKDYISKFQNTAVNEMNLFRIPASITLAQGIIESAAGTSKLAVEANNHFGIKCHKEWKGKTYIQDDDAKDECFRRYKDPIESFRDHSHFLTTRERYKSLFELKITDYQGWARGLKSAGYATNPKYADLLIRTIENHQLHRFDKLLDNRHYEDTTIASESALGSEVSRGFRLQEKKIAGRDVFVNNRRKMIIARSDDNIYQIAVDFNVSVEKLLRYNDLAFATSLKPGQIVYLENKRRRGSVALHTFREGESLYNIAQQYGIRLKMLYKRNSLDGVVEPMPGTILKLR